MKMERFPQLAGHAFLSAGLVVLASILFLPAALFAQSALTDDAHVNCSLNGPGANENNGDGSCGPRTNLSLGPSGGNVYLRFKLSSTLPAGTADADIARATLKLFVNNVTAPGTIDLYLVNGPWSEETIRADNTPPLGILLATGIPIQSEDKFLVFDVTQAVRHWLGTDGTNGIPNDGVALVSRGGAKARFDSKENTSTSHEAQLDIQLARGGTNGLQRVEHDASLRGEGTGPSLLGVAPGGVENLHLADNAVTGNKISDSSVGTAKLVDGSVTSAKLAVPLSLTSANGGFTLSATNTGSGAAITATGAINTTKQFSIRGQPVLTVSGNGSEDSNIFAGVGAGARNTTGTRNSFFGISAGGFNTTGSFNAFLGGFAGFSATTGFGNTFVGHFAGLSNTVGGSNTFVGENSGFFNTTGIGNTFIGQASGYRGLNPTGNDNTLVGISTTLYSGLNNATAIGARAVVTQSNSLVLGSIFGLGGAVANTSVGIGTPEPKERLDVRSGNVLIGSPGKGIILRSPDGATCRIITIDNVGALVASAITCP